MKLKYVLNLSSNHNISPSDIFDNNTVTNVFERNLSPFEYKKEENLRSLCREKIMLLEDKCIGFDEPIYIIYSGLAVILVAFISELIKEGYKPIVLFEDKDNGGYYKMEVDY